ncbi:MAG TPA: NAD-dependent epimerase/dehydratase family protein, partial [Candidatus Binatus sp.]|nr:NAD-dependent epimerase/dehydratase family protein [Candidatus Binatus sp.]
MRVLVTGGAGYVGSVSVEALVEAGHEVVVLDDLSTGHDWADLAGAPLVRGSYAEQALVTRLLRDHEIEAVLHCAARSLVGESMADPAGYYRDNVGGGIALL